MTNVMDLYYDPFDYEIDANVHAIWRRLRDEVPIYRNEKYDFWALSRYDDVLEAILDTERFSSVHGTTLDTMSPDPFPISMLIFMDPPVHTWHRKVVNRAFTPRKIAGLEARVVTICQNLLDQLEGRSEFDFVKEYAGIIPPTMIMTLVGFPEDMVEEWRKGIDNMLTVMSDGTLDEQRSTTMGAMDSLEASAGGLLLQVLPELMEERRKEPKEDLLSVLVHAEVDEGGRLRRLTDEEIFGFVMLLAAAGSETVARLLGWVATLLDRHPDQRAELVGTPTLIPNAIEECLRYEAPSPVQGRWVMKDVEVHGQIVPAESKILLINGSANRDNRHFPDGDRFDIHRNIDRHLSFGYGTHFCVGAALARLEGHVALRELLQRFPTWEVDYGRAEMIHTASVRGYSKLPILV
ncbi:MAG TPA: cytochrome P450 [Acidimicrobiales bacterium]|nr:cytochrome P450 [Acidimicrobiales bacterium]